MCGEEERSTVTEPRSITVWPESPCEVVNTFKAHIFLFHVPHSSSDSHILRIEGQLMDLDMIDSPDFGV